MQVFWKSFVQVNQTRNERCLVFQQMEIIKKQLRLLPKVVKPQQVSATARGLYLKEVSGKFEGSVQEKLSKAMREFKNHSQVSDSLKGFWFLSYAVHFNPGKLAYLIAKVVISHPH
jgi:hypothetical protein